MLIFCAHIWQSKQDLPFRPQFGKNCLKFLAIFCLAPLAEQLALSLFIYYFKFPNTEKQVESSMY